MSSAASKITVNLFYYLHFIQAYKTATNKTKSVVLKDAINYCNLLIQITKKMNNSNFHTSVISVCAKYNKLN